MTQIYIVREDEKIAEVSLPDDGRDLWESIEAAYPAAYDLIDEAMILPPDGAYYVDETIDTDDGLLRWLDAGYGLESFEGTDCDGFACLIRPDDWDTASVEWDDGSVMAVALNPGDIARYRRGWSLAENGSGLDVRRENARRCERWPSPKSITTEGTR